MLNEYVGLFNPDEEEEEDFNNEIKNDVSIPPPPEEGPNDVPAQIENPEDFHNKIQLNLGQPIPSQNLIEEGSKENERELLNPAFALQVDEQEDTGLGGLLRSGSVKKPNPNMMQMNNNANMNMNENKNANRLSVTGGKAQIKLSNFLAPNFFGDDDDDDDDGSGLFSRPQRRGTLGLNLPKPSLQNNMLLNKQNTMMQQICRI